MAEVERASDTPVLPPRFRAIEQAWAHAFRHAKAEVAATGRGVTVKDQWGREHLREAPVELLGVGKPLTPLMAWWNETLEELYKAASTPPEGA